MGEPEPTRINRMRTRETDDKLYLSLTETAHQPSFASFSSLSSPCHPSNLDRGKRCLGDSVVQWCVEEENVYVARVRATRCDNTSHCRENEHLVEHESTHTRRSRERQDTRQNTREREGGGEGALVRKATDIF